MIRKLVIYPADILRRKCSPVSNLADAAVQTLAADLLATVRDQDGLGLAAPQIGESTRMFVMRTPAATTEQAARRLRVPARMQLSKLPARFTVAVNPSFTAVSDETAIGFEACLSLPDYPALVRRSKSIIARYTSLEGESVEARLEGLPAIVFQHEADHLDGILIPDREVKQFQNSTWDREMDAAQRKFTLQLMKYYNDAGQIEEAERRANAVLR